MAELTVMNPTLYGLLKRKFGKVHVANPHQIQSTTQVHDPISGKMVPRYLSNGEVYKVSCCFCGDDRMRLWVNYKYGQPDESGRPGIHLVKCFNEDCLKDYGNKLTFRDMVNSIGPPVQNAQLREEFGEAAVDRIFEMPENCVPVSGLHPTHEAAIYLRTRGFSLKVLWDNFRLTYCEQSASRLSHRKLVAPVWFGGQLRGWQARPPFEAEWNQYLHKYDTCPGMRKSQLLYNFDAASKRETIVLVEGIADVWSFGLPACASFGDSLNPAQRDLLVTACTSDPGCVKSLVLLYDPEAYLQEKVQKHVQELAAAMPPGKFAAVSLPKGTDPGSLHRPVVRHATALLAAKQGVEVSWKLAEELTSVSTDDFD